MKLTKKKKIFINPYLDKYLPEGVHMYIEGLTFTLWHLTQGSMPGVGLELKLKKTLTLVLGLYYIFMSSSLDNH